jgi:hypothetical protein
MVAAGSGLHDDVLVRVLAAGSVVVVTTGVLGAAIAVGTVDVGADLETLADLGVVVVALAADFAVGGFDFAGEREGLAGSAGAVVVVVASGTVAGGPGVPWAGLDTEPDPLAGLVVVVVGVIAVVVVVVVVVVVEGTVDAGVAPEGAELDPDALLD